MKTVLDGGLEDEDEEFGSRIGKIGPEGVKIKSEVRQKSQEFEQKQK